ncbi:MAG: hypothetical protein AB3N23_16865 [Paracoccaceae bacterium]
MYEEALKHHQWFVENGFDTNTVGAVGEAYAMDYLGMTKAPRGAAGIDGYINGRSVSVKTKEHAGHGSGTYAAIGLKQIGLADDLLLLVLDGAQMQVFGPVAIADLPYRENKTQRRFFIRDIERAMQ